MIKNATLAVSQNIGSEELQAKQDSKSCSTTCMAAAAWQSIQRHSCGCSSLSIDTRDWLHMAAAE